jgi:hypothetical protein
MAIKIIKLVGHPGFLSSPGDTDISSLRL